MKSSAGNKENIPPPTVGALLRLAWLSFRERIYQRVVDAGYTDVQPVHVMLFRYPTIEGLRPTQLAEQASLSKQGINDLLRQLEARGYVRLEPDPDDRRAKRIAFTERGHGLMELMYIAAHDVSEDYARAVGRKRYDALYSTLLEMTRR